MGRIWITEGSHDPTGAEETPGFHISHKISPKGGETRDDGIWVTREPHSIARGPTFFLTFCKIPPGRGAAGRAGKGWTERTTVVTSDGRR